MKTIKKTVLLFSFLAFYNCAEVSSALSNYNKSNGGQCATYEVLYYVYNKNTSKYESGKIYIKDSKGNNIKYQEERWRDRLGQTYLNKGVFTAYYKTSPYSGGEYKFVVHCTRWH
ncbi:hypothetical protein MC378_04045 [Polaribacter sp. MSW13]|uniref:Lipoprotein n=1 Tax=Polaribacter marinus TaxID=2916838 RepID=A0A9X2AJE8_9FLAO|nr:hypothetical protein [Polaribacter marinus]MCI2228328.1 hypothetical protein [Polaribacter marinus]